MEELNVKRILDIFKPDINLLCRAMFPNALYPKQAFDRTMRGENLFTVKHLSVLAAFLGIPVHLLFNVKDAEEWHACNPVNCRFAFMKDGIKVECTDGMAVVTVGGAFHGNMVYSSAMSISDFLKSVEQYVESTSTESLTK